MMIGQSMIYICVCVCVGNGLLHQINSIVHNKPVCFLVNTLCKMNNVTETEYKQLNVLTSLWYSLASPCRKPVQETNTVS